MNTDEHREELNRITERIIGCAYTVSNTLGCGFLEKVYENALLHELRKAGFDVEQQEQIYVHYDGVIVGEYFADLLVDRKVILEIKAVDAIDDVHLAQCLNYLKATGIHVALIINFARPKLQIKRVVR